MLIGGLAVILRDVARVTTDVDATIRADRVETEALFRALAAHEIVGRIPDAPQFAPRTPGRALAWLPFEHEALDHAEVIRAPERIPELEAIIRRARGRA